MITITGFVFNVSAECPNKDSTEEAKLVSQEKIAKFSNKFREILENNLKTVEIKKIGLTSTYKTDKYIALAFQDGGYIRSLRKTTEITLEDLAFLDKILSSLFENIDSQLVLHPHLQLVITGDFRKILEKFIDQNKIAKLEKESFIKGNLGITLLFKYENTPIEFNLTPTRNNVIVYYCDLFQENKHPDKILLEFSKKVNLIENKLRVLESA
ncbi:MAG: hypothetical protein J4478_00010 [Candidatus Diapherotrites archaeon]|uniref:Uncharacterized protein n=1 Tax=Candidatus Iainarchaeum sp. TaxID=3101447 RepID=A0A8T4KW28_9ARCH|nr:hypothetical protein [Candidatus Diapherotrites archaeon]